MKQGALLVMGFILFSTACFAEYDSDDYVKTAPDAPETFVRGYAWRDMEEYNQTVYMTGVIDGMMASFQKAKNKEEDWFSACVKGKTAHDIYVKVKPYYMSNPSRWDQPMSYIIYDALAVMCKKQPPQAAPSAPTAPASKVKDTKQ